MTIHFDDQSYIVGIWFSENPINGNNWMATVVKSPECPKRYQITYRFRYKKDDKIFDSEDQKNWKEFLTHEDISEECLIKLVEEMQDLIQYLYPIKDRILVQGGLSSLITLAKHKDWMNIGIEKIQ